MRRGHYRLTALVLALCMVLGFFPGGGGTPTAQAADAVPYQAASVDETTHAVTFTEAECTAYTVVTSDTTAWSDGGWYIVDSDVTIGSRITVTGDVRLILTDGVTLTASAGITVSAGNSLTIYGQTAGTGKLSATGGEDQAGIGGNQVSGGAITIHGGDVTAIGGKHGAGIGGGKRGAGGTVTINGGTVTATGGSYSAGIGGGEYGDSGTITINGGDVAATSGSWGAGIGGGEEGAGGTVTINGGTVTATGKDGGMGIGAGDDSSTHGTLTLGKYVTVSGGSSADNLEAMTIAEDGTVSDRKQVMKTVYAPTPWGLLQAALNAGGTVTLTEDVTASDSDDALEVPEGVTVTLDLNGKTLDFGMGDEDDSSFSSDSSVLVNNGTLVIQDSAEGGTITGGHAFCGGGILNNGTLTLESGTIRGNVAGSEEGGGVFNDGTFTMKGGLITENRSVWGSSGGGVYNRGTFLMSGGVISKNSSEGNGGGVYNVSYDGWSNSLQKDLNTEGIVSITGGEITENTADMDGGGVYSAPYSATSQQSSVTISGGKISGNTASRYGGGVYIGSAVKGEMSGINWETFEYIYTNVEYYNSGSLTMKGGEISDNTAGTYGGGVYNRGAFTMNGGTITDNISSAEKTPDHGIYNERHDTLDEGPTGTIEFANVSWYTSMDIAPEYTTITTAEDVLENYANYTYLSDEPWNLHDHIYTIFFRNQDWTTPFCVYTDAEGNANGENGVGEYMELDGEYRRLSVNSRPCTVQFFAREQNPGVSEGEEAEIPPVVAEQTEQMTVERFYSTANGIENEPTFFVIVGNRLVVTLDSDMGNPESKRVVLLREGDLLSKPEDPVIPTPEGDGFLFQYWGRTGYVDEKYTDYEYDFSTPVTESFTLNAVYTKVTHTVSFDTGVSQTIPDQTVNYSEKAAKPANPSSGSATQVFQKWVLAETVRWNAADGSPALLGAGTEFDFSQGIQSNVRLKAQWAHKHVYEYKTLKSYLGSYYESAFDPYNEAQHVAVCKGCSDYRLEAHNFVNGVCKGCGMAQPVTSYKLRVYLNGSSSPALEREVKKGVTIGFYAPSISGYTFSKWQVSARGGSSRQDVGSSTYISFTLGSNADLYAVYNAEKPVKPILYLRPSRYDATHAKIQIDWQVSYTDTVLAAGILTSTNRGLQKVSYSTWNDYNGKVDMKNLLKKRQDLSFYDTDLKNEVRYRILHNQGYDEGYWKGGYHYTRNTTVYQFSAQNLPRNGSYAVLHQLTTGAAETYYGPYVYPVAYLIYYDQNRVVHHIYTNPVAISASYIPQYTFSVDSEGHLS